MISQIGDLIRHVRSRYTFWRVLNVVRGQVYAENAATGRRRWLLRPEYYRPVKEDCDAESTVCNRNV